MSIGGGGWGGVVSGVRPVRLLAHSLARASELPLFRISIILSISRRSRLRLLAGKVRVTPREMRVNFDHGCSGEHEKSDYEPVDTKRDCFRRSSRAPPDSFSRDNESNFFSLPT